MLYVIYSKILAFDAWKSRCFPYKNKPTHNNKYLLYLSHMCRNAMWWEQRRSERTPWADTEEQHTSHLLPLPGSDQSCWRTETKTLLSLSVCLVEETSRWIYCFLRRRQTTLDKKRAEGLHSLASLSLHHPPPASLLGSPPSLPLLTGPTVAPLHLPVPYIFTS